MFHNLVQQILESSLPILEELSLSVSKHLLRGEREGEAGDRECLMEGCKVTVPMEDLQRTNSTTASSSLIPMLCVVGRCLSADTACTPTAGSKQRMRSTVCQHVEDM